MQNVLSWFLFWTEADPWEDWSIKETISIWEVLVRKKVTVQPQQLELAVREKMIKSRKKIRRK